MRKVATDHKKLPIRIIQKRLFLEAQKIQKEEENNCLSISKHGRKLIRSGDTILTHCNAGSLATGRYGTALSLLYGAKKEGKKIKAFATETRPLLQGARLTTWELKANKIPVTLICDNMVATCMRQGLIDRVVVGADRIAKNGDTANKIGTSMIAVLAKEHNIPFYVAAPRSTFDFSITRGKNIPIEERAAEEITEGLGRRIAPYGVHVYNPAFDVTPAKYITAFVTEHGVIRPPFEKNLKKIR
jgi:methylthioribose-1-phosphate isomerase